MGEVTYEVALAKLTTGGGAMRYGPMAGGANKDIGRIAMEKKKEFSTLGRLSLATVTLLVFSFGFVPQRAGAQQAVAYMRSCAGCTLSGYASTAESQPDGVSFLYDLQKQDIRKFIVTSTTDCGPGIVPQAVRAQTATSCPPTKTALQVQVDASVVQIFNKMIAVAQANPLLWSSARDVVHLRNFPNGGIDPETHKPFDLPEAAWEYPSGSFQRFEQEVYDDINDPGTLKDLDPSLADLIYGIQLPSLQGLTINLAENPAAMVNLVFDRNSLTRLQVCNESMDCAEFTVQVTKTAVKISFQDVIDMAGNNYPEPNRNSKHQAWYWQDNLGAGHFGNFLNGHGMIGIPAGGGCWANQRAGIACSSLEDTNGKPTAANCQYFCQ